LLRSLLLSLPAFFARGARGAIPRGLLQNASPKGSLFEIVPPSASGITWRHSNGRSPEYYLPETTGAGCAFFDYDNDGWLDLFIANGHVYPEVEQVSPETHFKQINSLFHNEGNGKFVETTKLAGSGFQTPYVSRGVAFADFDNDGYMDLVVGNNGDPPLLLHNSGGVGNHFLNFKLVGTKSNRDGMGTRIRVLSAGMSQIREVAGGGSYLSQSDLRAHFGLGKSVRAESVEIKWPSGLRQIFQNVEADKFYQIKEGSNQLEFQKFTSKVHSARSESQVVEKASKVESLP
jgi:hypothetical protein